MKILHLTLQKKWFDMILKGKKEEYREVTTYWCKRLWFKRFDYDFIKFFNGGHYHKSLPWILIESNGVRIDEGLPKWGAPEDREVFVLDLGKILGVGNLKLYDPPDDTPKRIQRKRIKGWRMPENTVYVGRGSKWGNHHKASDYNFESIDQCRNAARRDWRNDLECDRLPYRVAEIQRELFGKNLACWCPLDSYCHADDLLEIANGT